MIEQFLATEKEAYLAVVEELTLEFKQASTAMTAGALSDFENSIVRQRIICARMAELKVQFATPAAASTSSLAASADPMMAARMKATFAAFETALRSYLMLLKHFGETARLFAGMFRGYGECAGGQCGLQQAQGAWSCEL